MSRTEATVLAARTLAVLLAVWALVELSYLPREMYGYLHNLNPGLSAKGDTYYAHVYLLDVTFRLIRVVGFFLMARWLRKSGPDVQELFWPVSEESPETT